MKVFGQRAQGLRLERMKASYAMQEQRERHAGQDVKASAKTSSIEFF